jgi:hypothetical protein
VCNAASKVVDAHLDSGVKRESCLIQVFLSDLCVSSPLGFNGFSVTTGKSISSLAPFWFPTRFKHAPAGVRRLAARSGGRFVRF